MELSDKNAILLVVHALPTADVWHEISPEEVRTIFQQASRELARLESLELSGGLTQRAPDVAKALDPEGICRHGCVPAKFCYICFPPPRG